MFEDAYNYMKSGTLCGGSSTPLKMMSISTLHHDRHLFNDIYEKNPGRSAIGGQRGRVLTRHAVTQFMVDIFLTRSWAKACWTRPAARAVSLTCTIEHLKAQVKVRQTASRCKTASTASRKSRCPTCWP